MQELSSSQLLPVQRLDLPPVGVTFLTVIVVIEGNIEIILVSAHRLEDDVGDVGFSEIQLIAAAGLACTLRTALS